MDAYRASIIREMFYLVVRKGVRYAQALHIAQANCIGYLAKDIDAIVVAAAECLQDPAAQQILREAI